MGKPEKRKETDQTGSTPTSKDARTETSSSATSTNTDSTMKSVSYAEVLAETNRKSTNSIPESTTSQRSQYNKDAGTKSGKETGTHRDQITVDILTIDGQPMKDLLSQKERLKVYEQIGLLASNYNGVSQGYSGHPTYTYRFKEPIDISLIKNPDVKIHRLKKSQDGTKTKQVIECKVRGIRAGPEKSTRQESSFDPNVKWVKFEKTKYKLSGDKIKRWLEHYGLVMTEVEEETEKIDDISDESDTDEDDTLLNLGEEFKQTLPEIEGTGTFKVKVRFNKRPPQYLPTFGQKSRIHYQGIEKICTNCYRKGHIKRNCTNEKKPWINYVKEYMDEHPTIPEELYGRWSEVVKKEFNNQNNDQEESQDGQQQDHQKPEQQQTRNLPTSKEQLGEITEALKTIRETETKRQQKQVREVNAERKSGQNIEAGPTQPGKDTTNFTEDSNSEFVLVKAPTTNTRATRGRKKSLP